MLALADGYGRSNGGQTAIELPLSQVELASLVCASRATVTRALRFAADSPYLTGEILTLDGGTLLV